MSLDPDPFQGEVAKIALAVAGEHGFALAGGHALIAHGIVRRPTEDVDLFTNRDGAVQLASAQVMRALSAAGLLVESVEEDADLGAEFYGFSADIAEFLVSRGDSAMRLTLARFDRQLGPITMAVGPVLHIDDVVGGKVAAMVTRSQPRDYLDVAAASVRYGHRELVELARRADPALTDEEVAEAMDRLDRLDDEVWKALYGLTSDACATLRTRFIPWPRTAR